MDIIDKKILLFLLENCRYPNSFIAKQLKVSEQFVKYRIERLEKEGIICKYITSVLFSSIGIFRYYTVYLKIKKTHLFKKKEIIDFLNKSPYVIRIIECEGLGDINFEITSAYQKPVFQLVDHVRNLLGPDLEDIKVFIIRFNKFMKRQPFIEKKDSISLVKIKSFQPPTSFQKEMSLFENVHFPGFARLEQTDLKILNILNENARLPLHTLATQINVNVQTVKKHISTMVQKGVLKHFTLHIDYTKMGFRKIVILFNTVQDEKKQQNIINYALHNFSALFLVFGYLDYWNLGIVAFFKDIEEVDKIIEVIMSNFSNDIFDYTKLLIIKDVKYDSFNKNLLEINKNARSLVKSL